MSELLKNSKHYEILIDTEEGLYKVVNRHTNIVEAEHNSAPQAVIWMNDLTEAYEKYCVNEENTGNVVELH